MDKLNRLRVLLEGIKRDCNESDKVWLQASDALGALELLNRRTQPENKPLTIADFDNICFEPIYVIPLGKAIGEWSGHWCIFQIDSAMANSDTVKGKMYFLYLEDYGKTWLAYKTKPEQEEK